MKNFLFLMIAAIMIVGCGSDKEEDIYSEVEYDFDAMQNLSLDSVHYYTFRMKDNKYVLAKKRRDDQSTTWSTVLVQPSSITVDLGYGNKQELEFSKLSGSFFDTVDLLFIGWETSDRLTTQANLHYVKIDIYSANGKIVNRMDIKPGHHRCSFVRWIDEKVILLEGENTYTAYSIIDKKGAILEYKEDVELLAAKDPLCTWNKGYITGGYNALYLCDLEKGTYTIDLENYVSSKYPEEVNKPRIEITKVTMNNNIATSNITITFYDGKKKNDIIKIDVNTHEIIN
ncbi:MAG: hypothetical protein KHY35_13470 [Bacteroides thetaiotaomicron]|uniref:Lipoprotein n=1 Tax=Bacteroides thetaiotaomicron TaxID=818 RepID=A0A943DW45_BACT4|nr:hypothetical protein [Bacteroides thetaiotaomicron]